MRDKTKGTTHCYACGRRFVYVHHAKSVLCEDCVEGGK